MKSFAAIALLAAFLPALMGASGSQPDNLKPAGPKETAPALPDSASASNAAAAVAENGVSLGAPKLVDQAAGLAVDNADAKNPKVVAYVGASWIVPATRPDKTAALAYVLDRGTGRLVARAHEIVPMPKPGVCYVDNWQLASSCLSPNDSVATVPGGGVGFQLDLGAGNFARMTISPGNGAMWGGGRGAAIKFAGKSGKMTVQQIGTNVQLIAGDDDGTLMASLTCAKTPTNVEQKFKDILAALSERPGSTRIWPADSNPRVTGVAGWAPPENGSEAAGIWTPQAKVEAGGAGGLVARPVQLAPVGQTFIAARILHPYDLPPAELIAGLGGGKIISTRPAELGEWVGTEKVIEFSGPAYWNFGQQQFMMFRGAGPAAQNTNYRVRLLDLHHDVRRLLVRCQSVVDQFDKFSPDFDKILQAMKIPDPPAEPVVVPLHPTTYKEPKK